MSDIDHNVKILFFDILVYTNFFVSLWRKKIIVCQHILNIFGLRFYFYSDEHKPVHVHIENSDGRAKINLVPTIELVENRNIKPKDIKKAMTVINLYKEEFVEAWNEFHKDEENENN